MSAETLILISDVHANLPALEAVLGDISRRGLSSAPVCFLGDAVNMGPFPSETVRALAVLEPAFRVRGNHDRYVAEDPGRKALEAYFRCPEGAEHTYWTSSRLDQGAKAWLGSAPMQISFSLGGADFTCFHASKDNDELPFPVSPQPVNILFGHVHSPFFVAVGPDRLAVNPGSVGSSLDGNPAASYAVLTIDRKVAAEMIRVKYDLAAFSAALEERSVPWAGTINRVVTRASLS